MPAKPTSVRALAVVYPCVTAFAVLATGNHFVLDIVAGLATIALAMACVRLAAGARQASSSRLRRAAARIAERRAGRPLGKSRPAA